MTGRERHQLLAWCELLIEGRLDAVEMRQFEQLVLSDAQARSLYFEYISLHGMLAWDAAGFGAGLQDQALCDIEKPSPSIAPASSNHAVGRRLTRPYTIAASAAALVLAAVVAIWNGPFNGGNAPQNAQGPLAENGSPDGDPNTDSDRPIPRIALPERPGRTTNEPNLASTTGDEVGPQVDTGDQRVASGPPVTKLVVESIDDHMVMIWEDYEVEQSAIAEDAEWLRRCYLDLVGHIPPAAVVTAFLEDDSPNKRERTIDELLASSGHTRHLATVWTNLLVGRRPRPQADRDGLAKFLREQFHSNAPWRDTVAQLLTAEGSRDENPASNFLLAHLNNEAVPATAVACRLFLGQQLLCAQCHKHPEHDWDQQRFWQLNACFQQTEVSPLQQYDPQTGTTATIGWELTEEPVSGPTYYEDMQGVVHAAYPGLDSQMIDEGEATDRREELMELLLADDEHQLAAAFVNRMWSHFFGYGLVNPVDDLGPHSTSIHSDLLRELAADFVASDYDVQELCKWICLSRPYQLSSQFSQTNVIDDPAAGEPALFSRMYLRSFSPEQLFDSLVVATSAGESGATDWSEVEARRREWARAFYKSAETDDNTELSTYEGSYSQALVLMNGDIVRSALQNSPGSLLFEVMTEASSDNDRLELLWLSTLSRRPTSEELDRSRRLVQQSVQQQVSQGTPIQVAQANTMGDVLWALLNSSEFSVTY